MQDQDSKILYVLVGPPAVGKSTWIRKQNFPKGKVKIISSDNIVEEIAKRNNMTYTEYYSKNDPNLKREHQRMFQEQFLDVEYYDIVIVDMTNLNPKSRKSIMSKIPDLRERIKIAVNFNFKGSEDLILRNAKKRDQDMIEKGQSKFIPPNVIESMFKSYSPPTEQEGFDAIYNEDSIPEISKILNGDLYESVFKN